PDPVAEPDGPQPRHPHPGAPRHAAPVRRFTARNAAGDRGAYGRPARRARLRRIGDPAADGRRRRRRAGMIRRLDPAQYRRTPWKKGAGTTIDIAGQDDVWRFGRTPIATPGPFSDYTGFDRMQVLVEGRGLVLETPDGEIDVRVPFKPVRFAGETAITSRLEAGPVEVVNLIGKRSAVAIDLLVIFASQTAQLGKGTHLVYAAAGAAEVDGNDVPADHCLRIDAPGPTMIACTGGVLLLGSVTCV